MGTANTIPPSSSAVVTAAAAGTTAIVATSMIRRTARPLPDTALADQVNCVHGSHSSKNSSAASPMPLQSGSAIRRLTSWEKANTNARSKKSSTGSAVKSSVRSGTSMPRIAAA